MNQIYSGIALIIIGSTLLIVSSRMAKAGKEPSLSKQPYLRNGGLGFVFFGCYYLIKYFLNI